MHTKSTAVMRHELRVIALAHYLLLLHLLLMRRCLRTDHSRRQVARSSLGVKSSGSTLRTNYHVSRTLWLSILLLHRRFLYHLVLKMGMHLCLLWNYTSMVTFTWMLLNRIVLRGIRYMIMLLLVQRFFDVVIVARINILNVYHILVFFIFSVFVGTK